MISYIMEHNEKYNFNLCKWIKKGDYSIIDVNPILGNNRKEILITNYTNNAITTLYNKKQIPEEV